jgi:hypothetical protein
VHDPGVRKVAVVSYLAKDPFSPRGMRTQELVRAFRKRWEVELISGPAPRNHVSSNGTAPLTRRLARGLSAATLIDRFEPWSYRHLSTWSPRVDAALLIGFPFSTLAWGAKRLVARGIPYVVDVGDPWILTARYPPARGIAAARSRRDEKKLWQSAAGAIVTTSGQAADLAEIFPELAILVRPNGYTALTDTPARNTSVTRNDGVLRLAHFGTLSVCRISVTPFLSALARSGPWRRIEFHQFGSDWDGMLDDPPESVSIKFEPSRPWHEVAEDSRRFDAVVVVGNRDPRQLPSKVIDYLVLSAPRIAVTGDSRRDSISKYVADKDGWLVVADDDPSAGRAVASHLNACRGMKLDPPVSESWPQVAHTVLRFFASVTGGR